MVDKTVTNTCVRQFDLSGLAIRALKKVPWAKIKKDYIESMFLFM